jgi:hypothetical protein
MESVPPPSYPIPIPFHLPQYDEPTMNQYGEKWGKNGLSPAMEKS